MNIINQVETFIQSIEISQIIDLIIALAVIIAFLVFSPLFSYYLTRLFYRKEEVEEKNRKIIRETTIYKTVRILFNIIGFYIATKILDLNAAQDQFFDKCFRIALMWFIAKAISGVFEAREEILEKANLKAKIGRNDMFMNFTGKILKIILYVIAMYLSLKEFGYDLGGIVTGLGIGGAIVVLAAQDIVKEAFAGATLFLDKPFDIGDWIEVGEQSGKVEDISLRSTKIRTINDTIVTVQNDTIIKTTIVNWGPINKRIYKANLKLALETEEVTIEKLLNRIRFVLKYNKDIIKDTISVQFDSIKTDGINIAIYLETPITDYAQYQALCNKINLTIMNILETQSISLAYPGQNIYIKSSEEDKAKTPKKIVKPSKITKE